MGMVHLFQTLLNWTDFQMPLEEAIQNPRLHLEGLQLNIEKGFDEEVISKLELPRDWQRLIWTEKSMFFGGVNGVAADVKGNLKGSGDERRFGVVMGE